MKISNNTYNTAEITGSLLDRLNQAVEDARTAEVGDEKAVSDLTLPETSDIQAPAEVEGVDRDQLDARLLMTVEAALEERFPSPHDVREAVVDVIVEEKFAAQLDEAELRRLSTTLKDALADDPEFTRQIDNMLVLAARKLGAMHSHTQTPRKR